MKSDAKFSFRLRKRGYWTAVFLRQCARSSECISRSVVVTLDAQAHTFGYQSLCEYAPRFVGFERRYCIGKQRQRCVNLVEIPQHARLPEEKSWLDRQVFHRHRVEPLGEGVPLAFFEESGSHSLRDLDDTVPRARLNVVVDGLFPALHLLHESCGLHVQGFKAWRVLHAKVANEECAE